MRKFWCATLILFLVVGIAFTQDAAELEKEKAAIQERGKIGLVPLTKEKLVEYTKKSYGKRPEDEWGIKLTILDVLPNSATVKINSVSFIDYAHLAKLNGEWKIVNVLWEPHPKKSE